jgi:hypothetical protein
MRKFIFYVNAAWVRMFHYLHANAYIQTDACSYGRAYKLCVRACTYVHTATFNCGYMHILSPHRTYGTHFLLCSHALRFSRRTHRHRRMSSVRRVLVPHTWSTCSVARLDSPCHRIAPVCLALHFLAFPFAAPCFSPEMSLSSLTFLS